MAESAEQIIRSIKRWCRGKCFHTEEAQQALLKRYQEGTFEQRVALKQELEDKFKVPHKPESSLEEVHAATLPLIFPFADNIPGQRAKVCGQDVNDLILADGKFDGENHEVICPKCGTKHIYSFLQGE